jgi:hypothetical protein
LIHRLALFHRISPAVRDPPGLVPDEIHIVYGIFIPRGCPFPDYAPVNVLAQVRNDLDELRIVGQRIWNEGAEKAVFRTERYLNMST